MLLDLRLFAHRRLGLLDNWVQFRPLVAKGSATFTCKNTVEEAAVARPTTVDLLQEVLLVEQGYFGQQQPEQIGGRFWKIYMSLT